MKISIQPVACLAVAMLLPGCGPSKTELDLKRKLKKSEERRAALERRVKRIGDFEKLVEKMSKRQGKLENELQRLKSENANLKAQAATWTPPAGRRPIPAVVVRAAPPPAAAMPPALATTLLDYWAERLALSPAQKDQVAARLKKSRDDLRQAWVQCQDAQAPPHVLSLLQRDIQRRTDAQIAALLDDNQRPRFAAAQADRRRSALPPRTLNLPSAETLAAAAKARHAQLIQTGFQAFVSKSGLTQTQIARLTQAQAEEQQATQALWASKIEDAAAARAALAKRAAIRQALLAKLQQALMQRQVDAYLTWRETAVLPKQSRRST